VAYFEAGAQKVTSAAAGPVVSIVPAALGSGNGVPEVRELGIFNVSGVAGELGLGYPAALGTGTLTSVTVQDVENVGRTGGTKLGTSYATSQPTAPTNFMRRAQLQGVIGGWITWAWNVGEFPIWSGASINAPVLWQISAVAVTYDVYIKVWEG
jgi:hypothetical protein